MNQEMKGKIYSMWNKGMTGTEIAIELKITRNSVMGVVHRLKKNGGDLRDKRLLKKENKAEVKKTKPKKNKEIKVEVIQEPETETVVVEEIFDDISDYNVMLEGLSFYSCRFIVKEGSYDETLYCGRIISRSSYCDHHYKLCYTPPRRSLDSLISKI